MVPSIEPLVPRWARVVQTRKSRTAKQMPADLHRETNDKFMSNSPPMMKSCCLMGMASQSHSLLFLLVAPASDRRIFALAHNLPGVNWRAPLIVGNGSQWPQTPTPDCNQPASKSMTYLLSQELNALKQNPVENFGAPGAIISMHADTKHYLNANSIECLRLSKTD